MKNTFYLIVVYTLLLIQCSYSQETSEWRGPNRDGIYPDTNLLDKWPEKGPELLWKFDQLGLGYSSPVIMSDKIYIT